MIELNDTSVQMWAAQPWIINRGGPFADGVLELEQLLAHFGFDPGPLNDVFDGRTESAVREYQAARMLQDDGIVGPKTRADILRAWEYGWKAGEVFPYPDNASPLLVYGGVHPKRGRLPAFSGKVSWFGGPDDEGDRGYGQALVPVDPPTVEELYRRHAGLVRLGLFRDGLADPLPMTTCCGKAMRAGISWCLDPLSFYLAMRWGSGQHRPDPYTNRVAIIRDGKIVIVAPTDWGPADWTGKAADLSLGAIRAIGAQTGQRAMFAWAEDNAPLGPVA